MHILPLVLTHDTIMRATVIVRAGGAIWMNTFSTVLLNVCSAITVECCV